MSSSYRNIHSNREVIKAPSLRYRCIVLHWRYSTCAFVTPKFKWLLFCLTSLFSFSLSFFFFLFQKSPVFKNTSKWQALKQMHSDQVEFWRGSVWAKATCDMYAQPTIIRCRYWMNSSTHISQTDSVKQEKFWCSVHRILMLLFLLLVCVAIQNMFGFFLALSIYVYACVYI